MELRNTNFKNIKIDNKENIVYKFSKAKNNYAIEEFDFLKKHVFQLSRSINFIPNITVWERNEYNLVIGMNLIKKSTSLKTIFENNTLTKNNMLITEKNLINYYRFVTYEVPDNFIKHSTKILKNGCILINLETGSYNNYLENILIDDKGKFWYLPYSSLKYYSKVRSILSHTDKFKKKVTFDFFNKFNRNEMFKKMNTQLEKQNKQLLTTLKSKEKFIESIESKRIKYSDVQKILGDNLFSQYFGNKNGIE